MPTTFMGHLQAMMGNYGLIRRYANIMPVGNSGVASIQDSDPVVYAPGAGTAPTASAPGFKSIGIQPKKMMTLVPIDREVTEDAAAAIGEIVGQSIARAFAKAEDKCGFIGDGSGTYFNFVGVINAVMALSGTVAYIMAVRVQATAGTWAAITMGDILALPGLIADDAEDFASPEDLRYFCHRNFFHTVMIPLAIAAGGTSAIEVLATAFGTKRTFAGYPVSFSQVFPRVKAAADHQPLILANLRQCLLLGDSRELAIETSREAYFTTDQIGIRGSERIALSPYNLGNLTTDTTPVSGAIAVLQADIA
jgi:HK97 family phage major capsid protein